jgi:hypothetical protein
MTSLVLLAGCDDGHVAGARSGGGDVAAAAPSVGATASDGASGHVARDDCAAPTLTKIVSWDRAATSAFAVGSDRLYWVLPSLHTPDSAIYAAPKDGGDVAAVAGLAWGDTSAAAVADGDVLYFALGGNIDNGAGALFRMMPDGTSALMSDDVPCSRGPSNQLAADEHELFYTSYDYATCATVLQAHIRATLKTGGPSRLVATAPRIAQLHVDGGYAYFIGDSATVSRVDSVGDAAIEPVVTSGLVDPALLAVADGTVYIGDSGQVLRVPATGGVPAVVWTHPDGAAGSLKALVVADGRIWLGWDDKLGSVATDGSAFVELATLGVGALALDERYVYVAAGDVYRICR